MQRIATALSVSTATVGRDLGTFYHDEKTPKRQPTVDKLGRKNSDGIDTMDAGAGNDDMFGGTGSDNLTGAASTDRFRFDTALSATTSVDHILNFAVVDDTIFLDRDIFTGIAVNGTLAAGAFHAGTAAGDADDRIVYDAATGNIFYDADGLGGVAQILFATVTAGTALTNADFNAYI
jgi:serralysin